MGNFKYITPDTNKTIYVLDLIYSDMYVSEYYCKINGEIKTISFPVNPLTSSWQYNINY